MTGHKGNGCGEQTKPDSVSAHTRWQLRYHSSNNGKLMEYSGRVSAPWSRRSEAVLLFQHSKIPPKLCFPVWTGESVQWALKITPTCQVCCRWEMLPKTSPTPMLCTRHLEIKWCKYHMLAFYSGLSFSVFCLSQKDQLPALFQEATALLHLSILQITGNPKYHSEMAWLLDNCH